MKTYFSYGDIEEAIYKAKSVGLSTILKRLFPGKTYRTKAAWNSETSKTRTSWWEIPAVQKRWNKLITGDENKSYFDYLNEKFIPVNSSILSPGCGTGEEEIRLAKYEKVAFVEGFDLALERIERARESAAKSDAKNISFFLADVNQYVPESQKYDAIFFDSFLHHVENIEEVLLRLSKGLKRNGLLVINEYVGPSRFQWKENQLIRANELLLHIPKTLRKREFDGKIKNKIRRPGIWRMILSDPSEAVNSENILPVIHKHFETLAEKPYGGNLLQLVLKDISHNFINPDETAREVLEMMFSAEDEFMSENESDFIFAVYRKNF